MIISYFVSVQSYQNCPDGWPTLLPCNEAPLVENRGFPYFYENGEILLSNLIVAYALWLIVTFAVFGIVVLFAKLLKRKH